MKFTTFLFFTLLSFQYSFSQLDILTAEERAYLFHIVKKSPILDNNIGRYFEYRGVPIHFYNGEINYDSLETNIINQPELLVIYTSEIRKSPIGIIAEAANKTAIWELNKMLLAFQTDNKKSLEIFQTRLQTFFDTLYNYLPEATLKDDKHDAKSLKNKIKNLLNPSYSLNEKIKFAESYKFLNKNEKFQTLEAINKSINSYVENRAYEIFKYLGGNTEQFDNVLVAAGDGSNTAGLLEEREKDERGRWNKGLPKAIGLFPYQLFQHSEKNVRNNAYITSRSVAVTDFKTFGNNKITNVHFDIWGYNSKKQTTIVIERKGKTYHLFGSGENRFLSPDSSSSKGITYQYIINGYKAKIAKIDEKIHGKKGYDYWIKYYENKRDKLKGEVLLLEKDIANISGYNIHTKSNSNKAQAGELNKTYSDKKNRREKQAIYIDKNDQLSATNQRIKDLEKEKAEAIEVRFQLEKKMTYAIEAFGRHWIPYTERNGFYTFEDSTTFDVLTQEFVFPASKEIDDFEVRLIAIPDAVDSPASDEVMLHINVTSSYPAYNNRVQLAFNDVFASNSWELKNNIITEKDSTSIYVFLEQLLDKSKEFNLKLRGNGLGFWDGNRTVSIYQQDEIEEYPNANAKNDTTFKRLRASYIDVNINRDIMLEINSYTDNVRTHFDIPNKNIQKLIEKNQASYNQILSAYRTASILFKLQAELNLFAGTNFEREKANIIIDRLNNTINKSKILVNKSSLKVSLFK